MSPVYPQHCAEFSHLLVNNFSFFMVTPGLFMAQSPMCHHFSWSNPQIESNLEAKTPKMLDDPHVWWLTSPFFTILVIFSPPKIHGKTVSNLGIYPESSPGRTRGWRRGLRPGRWFSPWELVFQWEISNGIQFHWYSLVQSGYKQGYRQGWDFQWALGDSLGFPVFLAIMRSIPMAPWFAAHRIG